MRKGGRGSRYTKPWTLGAIPLYDLKQLISHERAERMIALL